MKKQILIVVVYILANLFSFAEAQYSELLYQLAKQGNVNSQIKLAQCYANG